MALNHPGCYGMASCVNGASPSCRACPSVGGCLSVARDTLAKLPDSPTATSARLALSVTSQALLSVPPGQPKVGAAPVVTASSRGVLRIELNQAQRTTLAQLAPRVRKTVQQLMERGWFAHARSELAAGRNPAARGWQQVLCGLVLRGSFTRQELQLALATQLDLAPASARMQASVALAVFAAGQLVRESQGVVTPIPN